MGCSEGEHNLLEGRLVMVLLELGRGPSAATVQADLITVHHKLVLLAFLPGVSLEGVRGVFSSENLVTIRISCPTFNLFLKRLLLFERSLLFETQLQVKYPSQMVLVFEDSKVFIFAIIKMVGKN